MRLFRPLAFLFVVLTASACMEQASLPSSATGPSPLTDAGSSTPASRSLGPVATAASAMTATVQFGQPNVGSDYPPAPPHDQSAHAKDNLVPRTVVIDKGGTVTFNTFGVHQIAIYAPGTEPGDIDTTDLILTPSGCPKPGGAALLIDDDTNRIASYSAACGPGQRTFTYTFSSPGKYLVICTFLPHFQVQMYGWVIVRE